MGLISADAIVLQTFAYGETSRILKLLTRTHGLQSALAKGTRGPRSRFGGVLEPFVEGVITLNFRENRDLQTLTGFELRRARQGLGRELLRLGGASLIAELVLRTGSEEPQPALYDAVRDALDRLDAAEPEQTERLVLTLVWQLVGMLGFAPELEVCLACGRELAPPEETRFSYSAGGLLCTTCAVAGGGALLPARARAALQSFLRGDVVPLERTVGHWRLLQRYLDHHVLEGGNLRSLDFLTGSLPED